MIATNEAADVLRHGWQDAANSLAADVPEVADLLQARVEMAIATHRLDERHLLETIAEVESITSRAGSSSGEILARRLRRTVYEYLLALDAVRPSETTPVSVDQRRFASDGPMVGAEEVAALGHAAATANEPRVQPPDVTAAADAPATESPPDAVPTVETEGGGEGAEDGEDDDPVAAELSSGGVSEVPAAGAEPSAEGAGLDQPDSALSAFVAPRAGFHIVDDDGSHRSPADHDEAPIQMPAFSTDEPPADAEVAPPGAGGDGGTASPAGDEFLAWQPAAVDSAPPDGATATELSPTNEAATADHTPPAAGAQPVASTSPTATAELTGEDDDDTANRGWRVRDPRQASRTRGSTGAQPTPEPEEDPFEANPKLADMRKRIEERLRRKRCDEAAALLQALAQETGGRAVADLAMNAGDRCRALGKSNAALNCYLAASRADPVYELPLSRLADVCIDAQDTELAVTYLERIARLYRHRGNDKEALRVYRRIATIAPDREDVLTLLMNAQSTGRLD